MKEVWICDHNYHKIWLTFALIFSKNYQWFEKLYQTFKRVFHLISKHLEVEEKTLPRLVFSTTSRCLDLGRNTLPCVWYITWLKCFFQTCRGSSICRHLWQHSVLVWEGLQCSKKTSENHWRGSCPRCILWGAAENWWGSCEGSGGSWLCWSRYWCLPWSETLFSSTQKFVQETFLLNQKGQIVIWSRVTDARSHWDFKIQSKTTGLFLQA